jgi:adenylyl- and sulfurtransferase ThiI
MKLIESILPLVFWRIYLIVTNQGLYDTTAPQVSIHTELMPRMAYVYQDRAYSFIAGIPNDTDVV